jgi:hypothetical protein
MPTSPVVSIERDLLELLSGPVRPGTVERLAADGLEVLPALEPYLASDLPIAALERFEDVWKRILARTLRPGISGADARTLAAFQQRLGPLLKYKSYAVKAASPLGYSIFLQNPGEGFSFQRHLTHKVEVFHILDVLPGGFVFLASFGEWRQVYDPGRFAEWLAGAPDPVYERYRIAARPGDVFVIRELGIVHTAVGCVLEEFATVSTDMVDRLHDQNEGRPIPPHFRRPFVLERLAGVRSPESSRRFEGLSGEGPVVELVPQEIQGGHRVSLFDDFVGASLISIETGRQTSLLGDPNRAASLYVRGGAGRILLGTRAELARATPPSLPLAQGDLLILPPGASYVLVQDGLEALELVLHEIEPGTALI